MNQNDQRQQIKDQKASSFRPFSWRRLYRDWRFLTVLSLIVVAVVSYLLTGDLSWQPRGDWNRTAEKSDKHGTDLPPVTNPKTTLIK